MKNTSIKSKAKSAILALSFVLAATTGANAASNQSQNPNGQPLSATELLAQLDTNHDSRISKNEVKGPLSQHFSQIDSNSDGYITKSELESNKPSGNMQRQRSGQRNGQPPSATEVIAKMDVNKDNRLSQSEVNGPLSQHFSQIDTNNDGYITQAELENAPKPQHQRRG